MLHNKYISSALFCFFFATSAVAISANGYSPEKGNDTALVKSSQTSKSFLQNFKISGDLGFNGELSSITGREERRPPASGRLFLRPTLFLFDNFSVAFDLYLSTEGNEARQQINQIALHPDWGWGKAHVGDFTHEFSRLTLSGVSIRGAGVELYPSYWRIQIVGGQTQRAIENGPYGSAYSRYMLAAKLGFNLSKTSFLDLNVLRIKDDVKSLSNDIFKRDTALISSTPQYGTTPQENLVAGINYSLNLFDNMAMFSGEFAGSVYSKDLYGSKYTDKDIPSFVYDIYSLNISSRADFAYNLDFQFNNKYLNARSSYSVINPGYTSLGLSSNINDRKYFLGGLGFRLFNNAVSVNGAFSTQRNNLLKQLVNTLTRDNLNLNASIRPSNELTFILDYLRNSTYNDATNDTIKINSVISSYSLSSMWQFNLFNIANSLIGAYSAQITDDLNILRKSGSLVSQNITASVISSVSRLWSISPGFSFNVVEMPVQGKTTTSTINLRITNRMFDNILTNSITTSYTTASLMTSTLLTFQSDLSITRVDKVSFRIRATFFRSKETQNNNFTEFIGSINYLRRF